MSSRATSIFGPRAISALPPGHSTVSALSSQSNAMPSPTWLAAIMSSFLRLSLAAGIVLDIVGLGGEADHERTLRHVGHRFDDVGRRFQLELDRAALSS